MSETVQAFKGFDRNLQCRGFQYEVGKTYEMKGKIEACGSGFHACEHPLDVFGYYPPTSSRYAAVTQAGKMDRGSDKIASAKITIQAELSLPEYIEHAIKWVFDRAKPENTQTATGEQGAASATGEQGAASATGTRGAASATGDQGVASATGYQGAASATGTRGAASATGEQGVASATGYQGAASACGYAGRVMGADGCALFLVYRSDWNGPILHTWSGIAGRNGVKPNVWYSLNADGSLEEST